MIGRRRGVLCDRARAWAALAPDGELSEVERKLLDAHLTRCHACEAFAVEVAAVSGALRRERLVPLSHPITIVAWRRRSGYARIRAVGAVAAVALMAVGLASRAPLPADERESVELPRVTNFSNDAEAEVDQILRAQSRGALARVRPGRQGVRKL
jgi:anti-sigma factor RsiW